MRRYLRQLGTFLAPRSVDAADSALRQLARWMITEAGLAAVGDVRRDDIEDYKVWLAAQPRGGGQTITAETHRQRMRTVRQFFERIIEWDWPGAPPRNPVIAWDIPKKPEPLPKFLDDRDAARLMAAARASTDPRDRLVVELLARIGMRAGELAGLDADAVVQIGAGHWLRIPLGKLRNDRYVPLHPELVSLLTAWTAANLDHIRRCKRLVAEHRGPLDRHLISRIVHRVARAAGVPGVHPHRLRHTLATQAINRGMRLEAIAALLGHYAGDFVKLILSGGCLVEAGQQSVEDFRAPGLALGGGVVALLLEGGAGLDGGLEERARFADGLEVAVQAAGAGAVAVAEHPLVHLGPEFAHFGALGADGQVLRGVVEGLDLLRHREVLLGHGAVGDAGIHHGHPHRSMAQ